MTSRQELFDNAALGIMSQDYVRSLSKGICVYRGDSGRRCAIGWSIPDSKMRPGMNFSFISDKEVQRSAGVNEEDLSFAFALQYIHDKELDWPDRDQRRDSFCQRMSQLALNARLDDSKLWWEVQ